MVNIGFVVICGNRKWRVFYDENIILKNFMLDFIKKHSPLERLEPEYCIFKLGDTMINTQEFMNKKLKEVIKPRDMISFCLTNMNKCGGGVPLVLTDVSNNKVMEIDCDYALTLQLDRIHMGINIFGICKNEKCVNYNKKTISNFRKDSIDMIKEKPNIKCERCNEIIIPKTLGFYQCKYHIFGKKIKRGNIIPFDMGYRETKDDNHYDYFDELENGQIMFTKLYIEIKNK